MAGVKGRSGGARPNSGPKPKPELLELRNLLNSAWTLEQRQACIAVAVQQARQGSVRHLEILLNYGYGKPHQRIEHAGDPEAPVHIVLKWAQGIDEPHEPGQDD